MATAKKGTPKRDGSSLSSSDKPPALFWCDMKRLAIILSILLALPCWAENDPASDANCVALYNFESGAFLDDSSGNGNHLIYEGGWTSDTVNEQEGDACATILNPDYQYWSITDADLSNDFPGKNGQTNNIFSIMCWVYFDDLPGTYHEAIVGKWASSGWLVTARDVGGGVYKPILYWAGTPYTIDYVLSAETWYFIKFACDDPNNYIDGCVYDASDSSFTKMSNTPGGAIGDTTAVLAIGDLPGYVQYFAGKIDNLCLFNRKVTDADANDVRADTYNYAADPNLIGRWRFEAGALNIDEEGNNHFFDSLVPSATAKQGSQSADAEDTYSGVAYALDAALSSGFPGKNGETNNTMTVCYWYRPEAIAADYIVIVGKWGQSTNTSWWTGIDGADTDDFTGDWGGSGNSALSGQNPAPGQWYHVALILDDSGAPDYRYLRVWDEDGTTVYTDTEEGAASAWPATTQPFSIGASTNNAQTGASNDEADGLIDEVIIFNRRLSDAEIDAIRGGTFLASSGTSNNDWWWRRRHN